MSTYKVRNTIIATGGIAAGSSGTTVANLMFGTVTITCPSAAASTTGSNSASVTNLPAGAKVFVTAASIQQGFVLVSACVTAASTITASFLNSTTANISSSALTTLQYLAIS